jgi:hypothetical protein
MSARLSSSFGGFRVPIPRADQYRNELEAMLSDAIGSLCDGCLVELARAFDEKFRNLATLSGVARKLRDEI